MEYDLHKKNTKYRGSTEAKTTGTYRPVNKSFGEEAVPELGLAK